jgi:hypothetical protein
MRVIKQMMMASMVVAMVWTLDVNCAPRTVYVRTAPPAVKAEVKPAAPYKNAVWIAGRWAWKKGEYVWVTGHWVKPRSGYAWVPGHWVKKRRGWIWIEGHWRKL